MKSVILAAALSLGPLAAEAGHVVMAVKIKNPFSGTSKNLVVPLTRGETTLNLMMHEEINILFREEPSNQRVRAKFKIQTVNGVSTNNYGGIEQLSLGNGRVVNETSFSEFGSNLDGVAVHPEWFGIRPKVDLLLEDDRGGLNPSHTLVFNVQAPTSEPNGAITYSNAKQLVSGLLEATRGVALGQGDTNWLQGKIDDIYTASRNEGTERAEGRNDGIDSDFNTVLTLAEGLALQFARENVNTLPRAQAAKIFRGLFGFSGSDDYLYHNDPRVRALAEQIRRESGFQNDRFGGDPIRAFINGVLTVVKSPEYRNLYGI